MRVWWGSEIPNHGYTSMAPKFSLLVMGVVYVRFSVVVVVAGSGGHVMCCL